MVGCLDVHVWDENLCSQAAGRYQCLRGILLGACLKFIVTVHFRRTVGVIDALQIAFPPASKLSVDE